MRTFSAQTRLQLQADGIKAAVPLKMVMLPSIDKDTHGFDGQKERPYILKDLGNTQSIPCGLFVV